MKIIAGRIFSAFLTAGGWLLAGVRLVLDLIGYSTAPEDVTTAKSRLDQFFGLVLSAPWWAVWGFALVSTLWLIWVSWPRNAASSSISAANNPNFAAKVPHDTYDGSTATEIASTTNNGEVDVDENVYNELVWFCIDHLVPACDAQIALIKQTINELTKSGYVAMYAWRGAVDHFRSFGFWDSYEKLSDGLSASPMSFTSYVEIAECVAAVERNYNSFCGQIHLLSNEGKFDYKRHSTTAPLWEEWRAKHNAMVTAYEKIKRDSRFGKLLFRPVRESRWGGIIEPIAPL